MDTPVTVGLILRILAVGIGVAVTLYGLFISFAAGMASSGAPKEARIGCTTTIAGAVIIAAGTAWMTYS